MSEVQIPRAWVERRYLIPKSSLVEPDVLLTWGREMLPIDEVSRRLKAFGHTDYITPPTLWSWSLRLGIRVKDPNKKSDPKTFYAEYEVAQLDNLYRLKHLCRMTFDEIENDILSKGLLLKLDEVFGVHNARQY